MEKANQLSRTCTSCGIQKPLSAFLQLEGAKGSNYGVICSACRGKEDKNKTPLEKESDDESHVTAKLRIGTSEKMYADRQKQIHNEEVVDEYEEEIKKRDELKNKLALATDLKAKAEREHHKFYLETKQKSFLDKKLGVAQPFLAKKAAQTFKALTDTERATEIRKLETIFKQQQKLTTADLQGSPLFHEARYQTPAFMEFINRFLGPSSPLRRYLDDVGLKTPGISLMSHPQPMRPETKEAKISQLEDYIEKTIGPSSRKR